MFGRNRKSSPVPADANQALHAGLRRGGATGSSPIAAEERFPTAAELMADPSLTFDPDNRAGKLYLGVVGGQTQSHGGYPAVQGGQLLGLQDDRHAMLVAGSRAGKGRSVLLPILATWPGPVIVIDPKLDLATETAALRARRFNQPVHVIDPFGAGGKSCDPFRSSGNPLNWVLGKTDDDLIDLAGAIADGMVVLPPSTSDPHWNDSARDFLEAVILHVLTHPRFENRRTLTSVHEVLTEEVEDHEPGELSELEKEMIASEAAGGAVAAGAIAYYDKADRERLSVLSTLRRHLRLLNYPRIRDCLGNGAFDVRAMHETPRSLYIGLPASKMRSCAGLPRLLINLALNAFEAGASRRDFQHQKGRAPCLLVMDEFFTMGPMDRIEAAAGQMAGFGVKLLPVLQDLSQLQTLYPKSWQTFAGNCGVMWFFGNTDLATLEFLEKRLGQTRVYSPSRSDQSYDAAVHGGATGASFSLGSHPLMSVPELARIFQRDDPLYRALVLSTRHGPMIVQRAFYDAHPAFRGLFSAAK